MNQNKLQMGWGNPEFLHPYWENYPTIHHFDLSLNKINNYQFTGLPELKVNIRKLHEQEQNAEYKDKHIVIGNGTTQLLNAFIRLSALPNVYAPTPCYQKFKRIANLHDKEWKNTPDALNICTLPNNPDGTYNFSLNSSVIYDLSYNWKIYTKGDPQKFNYDIMLFGLSKACGLSSARIGWALIRDEALAQEIEEYIELMSCGTSLFSQKIAAKLIDNQTSTDLTVFDYGKIILNQRWEELGKLNLPFKVLNDSGMFLYCEGKCPEELISISGEEMGVSSDHFRLNLGVNSITWSNFKGLYGTK